MSDNDQISDNFFHHEILPNGPVSYCQSTLEVSCFQVSQPTMKDVKSRQLMSFFSTPVN